MCTCVCVVKICALCAAPFRTTMCTRSRTLLALPFALALNFRFTSSFTLSRSIRNEVIGTLNFAPHPQHSHTHTHTFSWRPSDAACLLACFSSPAARCENNFVFFTVRIREGRGGGGGIVGKCRAKKTLIRIHKMDIHTHTHTESHSLALELFIYLENGKPRRRRRCPATGRCSFSHIHTYTHARTERLWNEN